MIIHGDCLEKLKLMDENSVDSVVTDPPWAIKFMSKKWDYQIPSVDIWKQVLRVLKPGGHALICCGTRTQHRMVLNVEDAGFDVRDICLHLYGSGFPKSHNIGNGIGTALKPAVELWTLARKPLSEKTVAANVLKHGTGGLNIDASRIGTDSTRRPTGNHSMGKDSGWNKHNLQNIMGGSDQGRWPANLILDEDAAALLDEQSGVLKSGAMKNVQSVSLGYHGNGSGAEWNQAKASRRERNAGLEGMPEQKFEAVIGSTKNQMKRMQDGVVTGERNNAPQANHHPTVKPVKLMEYLIRLVTPPNGTVLDPFMGSGSTGVAAKNLGFEFIGIEMNADYVEIAKRRVE